MNVPVGHTQSSCSRAGPGCRGITGRMQVELLDRQGWRTRVDFANAIFDYLEIVHNRQRRHSALGMLTPIELEKQHQEIAV